MVDDLVERLFDDARFGVADDDMPDTFIAAVRAVAGPGNVRLDDKVAEPGKDLIDAVNVPHPDEVPTSTTSRALAHSARGTASTRRLPKP